METPAGLYHRLSGSRAPAAQRVLAAENRIVRSQIRGRLRLTDGERRTFFEIGKQLGKKADKLKKEVANIVRPDTILGWHRKLVAKKFDGSQESSVFGPTPNRL